MCNYLCICDQCIENEYGSRSEFEEHDIAVSSLNKVALQANADETTYKIECETVLDFAQVGSIVAIPASSKSVETVNFVKIVDQSTNESEREIVDDWGQVIKGSQSFLEAHYLFRSSETINGSRYKVDSRSVYICKEYIVYPFVQADVAKGNIDTYFISNAELCTVVDYVQTTGMCHL